MEKKTNGSTNYSVMENREDATKLVKLEIKDNYGNVFDVKDSILNTATLEYCAFISFYNEDLGYIFEYFFDTDKIWLEGYLDANYWNDERLDAIIQKMKKTNMSNINECPFCNSYMPADIDLEDAVNIMFEEMVKYFKYIKNCDVGEAVIEDCVITKE